MNQKLNSKKDFEQLLEKYLQGQCTPLEEKIILKWYEATGNGSSSNLTEEELESVEARIQANIKFRIYHTSERSNNIRPLGQKGYPSWSISSIAAAVVFLVLSAGLIYQFALRR